MRDKPKMRTTESVMDSAIQKTREKVLQRLHHVTRITGRLPEPKLR